MKEKPDILADKNASDIGSENLNAEQIEIQRQRKEGARNDNPDDEKVGPKKEQGQCWNKKYGEQENEKDNKQG